MYKVIAVDLDGTLLSPENKIEKYTTNVIKSLIKKGFYFIFASGRHYLDIMTIQNQLNIKTFIVSSNGSQIYDLNNNLILNNNLDITIAESLCKIQYSDTEIITQVYCKDKWFINSDKLNNKFCPALSSLQYEYFHLNCLDYKNISKIFFTSLNYKKLYTLERKIIQSWKNQVTISFSAPGCLEVVSQNTSKGNGLKLISNQLGISIRKFLAFGDGMNDQDMLSIVGKGCIMGNGDIRLKNALPYLEVIGSNKNESVAVFLYNMFLKT